jgi:hypothetical protein
MTPQAETREKWYQIARADTKGKIMDFTDPNPSPVLYVRKRKDDEEGDKYAPKIAANISIYGGEENKASVQHLHWVDLDALALLAWDILTRAKGDKLDKGYTPILAEFKGGPARKNGFGISEDQIVSRQFTVTYNDGLNIGPVYQFRFIVVEGRTGDKGQVMPVKDAKPYLDQTVNVSVQAARKMALTIQRYLQAKMAVALDRHDFRLPDERVS